MSRRLVTTVDLSISIQLRPGASPKKAREFLMEAVIARMEWLANKDPLKGSVFPSGVRITRRETQYL